MAIQRYDIKRYVADVPSSWNSDFEFDVFRDCDTGYISIEIVDTGELEHQVGNRHIGPIALREIIFALKDSGWMDDIENNREL